MKKKFISVIRGYHKQIFNFNKEENYHMLPIDAMRKLWYQCEIYALDAKVRIEEDPNFIRWTKVIYHTNLWNYLLYIFKNRKNLIYSNSITIKTLIVSLIWKYTVFCPHAYPFWNTKIKKIIIVFFYYFFKKIRVNNLEEVQAINRIKKNLALYLPLSISTSFFSEKPFTKKKNQIVWIWNLTPIKNPLYLIEVAKIIKKQNIPLQIIIIWEDRMKAFQGKTFDSLIQGNHLQEILIMKGVLSHAQIKEILFESKYYLNTSISEGQCLAVYEASLAWCYLFLPQIMAFRSVFKYASYFTSPLDLANQIQSVLDNNKIGKEIQFNQKFILKSYNYEVIEKKFQSAMLNLG